MKYSGQNSIRGLIELIKNKFDTKLDSTANAVSASKIEKPVTLSFTGGVAGSASFDGSTDIDISLDVLTGGGVYVGTGDMPDGYNVQIDPNGDAWEPDDYALANHTHTASDIGALDEDALDEAIDTALTQAKASGEFDGEDGYTPVRGTDYWTAADIAEIKSYVDDAILGGSW